jgi:hypothetical protein
MDVMDGLMMTIDLVGETSSVDSTSTVGSIERVSGAEIVYVQWVEMQASRAGHQGRWASDCIEDKEWVVS